MPHRLTAIAFVILASAALPINAFAAGTLDQEQSTYDGFSANSTMCVGQTFTAGLSGRLDRVSLYVRRITDHPVMRVELRDATAGVPGDTVLATQDVLGSTIPADTFTWIDFDFSPAPIVLAGTTYAIVAPPLGPMGPEPDPWGFEIGGAQQTISNDPYVGGGFVSANSCDGPYGLQSTDLTFRTYVDTSGAVQPDGQIRRNFRGWIGGNIYNSTGAGQSLSAEAGPRSWVLFRIGIQNDGFLRDRFTVDANGGAVAGYRTRYFRYTAEITSAVNAGTYVTRWLGPGERVVIEAWVRVKAIAEPGSAMERSITISSTNDATKHDVLKFTVRRR